MTAKRDRRRKTAIQIDDDEWTIISWLDQHEQCCNCGLVHTVDFRVKDGQLQFKARRVET